MNQKTLLIATLAAGGLVFVGCIVKPANTAPGSEPTAAPAAPAAPTATDPATGAPATTPAPAAAPAKKLPRMKAAPNGLPADTGDAGTAATGDGGAATVDGGT